MRRQPKNKKILLIILAALVLSACSRSTIAKDDVSNITKQELLRIANQVDEIRVFSISSGTNVEKKGQRLHRYQKKTVDFERFIKELKESADSGVHLLAVADRYIVLLSKDNALMTLEGFSGNGQFFWSERGHHVSNLIYLSVEGQRFVE